MVYAVLRPTQPTTQAFCGSAGIKVKPYGSLSRTLTPARSPLAKSKFSGFHALYLQHQKHVGTAFRRSMTVKKLRQPA
ncbi:hypothetical protein B0G71_3853 [Paraburkholderia sp. BL27I4N3]|nr:hypothetical protein B0G71_3853 [Paraburkholderia sp. BL27I4N3]